MSSRETKIQKQKEWELELQTLEIERNRKATLSLFEKIMELDASDDLKQILFSIEDKISDLTHN